MLWVFKKNSPQGNYALFRVGVAACMTLTSLGPVYALPLSYLLQAGGERKSERGKERERERGREGGREGVFV